MKIRIKILHFTTLLISIMLLPNCSEDFLDRNPTSVYTEDTYFKSVDELEKGLIACYSYLNSGNYEFELWATGNVGSDDADCGNVQTDQPDEYDISYSRQKSTNSWVEWSWRDYYVVISRCNFLIDKAKLVEGDTIAIEKITDQAKFLRAMSYYHLVTLFGDVPMPLKFNNPNELNLKRSTAEEVWNQIESDLKDATDLPTASEWNSSGRITSGAVYSLLGKVYVTQKRYTEANRAFHKVLQSGEYQLAPDYGFIFRSEGENCRESIFEFQYKGLVPGEPGMGNYPIIFREPTDSGSIGYGFDCPTQDLLDEFEPGDPRIIYTFIFKDDVFPSIGGQTYVVQNIKCPTGYHNRKVWIPLEQIFSDDWDKNFRYLRYSEVLLLYAESLNEINKPDSALMLLNMIRERARNTSPTDPERLSCAHSLEHTGELLPDVTTKNQNELRKAIWHEQRVELGEECHRREFLLRTGQFKERMEKAKEYAGCKVEPHELLLPIPESERTLSNYAITQNPGY